MGKVFRVAKIRLFRVCGTAREMIFYSVQSPFFFIEKPIIYKEKSCIFAI